LVLLDTKVYKVITVNAVAQDLKVHLVQLVPMDYKVHKVLKV
jgi:hypothetical protein